MNEQEKLLQSIVEYEKAMEQFHLSIEKFKRWREEILSGHATSKDLRTFLTNMEAYEREKDRMFATYLGDLLK